MSEYTPSDEDVRNALIDAAVGTMRGAYKRIARVETAWAFDRWLAEHDAALVEKLADEWTRGAWANVPRKADRAADRLAAANYVGDWLRACAAEIREGAK